jgi:hypothetical protein
LFTSHQKSKHSGQNRCSPDSHYGGYRHTGFRNAGEKTYLIRGHTAARECGGQGWPPYTTSQRTARSSQKQQGNPANCQAHRANGCWLGTFRGQRLGCTGRSPQHSSGQHEQLTASSPQLALLIHLPNHRVSDNHMMQSKAPQSGDDS